METAGSASKCSKLGFHFSEKIINRPFPNEPVVKLSFFFLE
jgi:hypothetical protein